MKRTILLFSLILFVAAFGKAQENSEAKNAEIKFEKKVHDYGKVYKNRDGTCSFKFKNTGSAPLVVTSVRSSCGCTVPEKPDKPIKPGNTSRIKVNYDTRRVGPINRQITVHTNANEYRTVVLKIEGKVLSQSKENAPEKSDSDID